MKPSWRSSIVILLLIASPVAAQQPRLSSPPKAARSGDQVSVVFSVNQPTDVEVAVLDAKGKVVRHLAAGVLGGKNPPPAPLKPGLQQQVLWDGKDDVGKPGGSGPFQFRVRIGTSVRFGKMIGGSPYTGSVATMPFRAPVNGLVTDAEGNVYVLMMSAVGSHGNSGMWPWHLRKFDRQGTYVRTILPYPPSTDSGQASGFQLIGSKSLTPALQTSLYPVFTVLGNEIMPRLIDGQVVFVHSEARRLNFLALDGSNRLRTVPMWSEKTKINCPSWLDIQTAISPDGKYAYYSNLAGVAYDGKKPGDIDPLWPQGRIYRQNLSQPGTEPAVFFDFGLPDWDREKYWMPSAWDKKSAAAGIDIDAAGNVLVCDLVNHQVVEISPAGKKLSVVKVPWPDRVLVSRKTGDLYVISRQVSRGQLPPATLYRIAGRGPQRKVMAELPLPGTIGGGATLDETGKVPVLWLAGMVPRGKTETVGKLFRVEDQGAKLVVTGDSFLNRDENAIAFVGYMDVDREAELVYVTRSGGTVWRYHGETGKGGPLEIRAVDLAVGPGGDIWTWGTSGGYEGPIARYTRDLKPVPIGSTEKHTYGYLYGRAGRGASVCGLDVDLHGRVYATWGTNDCHVRVYDSKGDLVDFPGSKKLVDKDGKEVPVAIAGVTGYGGSIRVDAAGNIYLLQAGVLKDHPAPPGFDKDEGYRNAVGTIYKFPPTGGEVLTSNGTVKGVLNALMSYSGCGPVSRWRAVGACACTKPRFDVDGFGRLYIPNAITFSVSVRDNAGNEIVQFGGYGNHDCQGPGSAEPRPDIPLGWPVTAGASDRFIYVGDCLNHRVVRVDRHYAGEAVVRVE
jgi:hypothetical protein